MASVTIPKQFRSKQATPLDRMQYIVTEAAIEKTSQILLEYGNDSNPHEGLVYWGGKKEGDVVEVRAVIAPATSSRSGRVSVSNRANVELVRTLTENNFVYLAQIHSHPGKWVDHSDGDNEWAAFKFEGLLSIVVPVYCRRGMLPLARCGIHRYQGGGFVRLSNEYVKSHFRISNKLASQSWDYRDD